MVSPGALGLLLAQSAVLLLAVAGIYLAMLLYKGWDFSKSSAYQYALEDRSFLLSTIGWVLAVFEVVLLLYSVYLIESLSAVIRGAMCGVGVLASGGFGWALLGSKIASFFLLGCFVYLDYVDRKRVDFPFSKQKFMLFALTGGAVVIESVFAIFFLLSINPAAIVSCCGTVFSSSEEGVGVSIYDHGMVALLMAGALLGQSTALLRGGKVLYLVTPIFFSISLFGIIYLISPYIYELPTHNCPFCLLQKEYFFIGYLLYGLLFSGALFSLLIGIGGSVGEGVKKYRFAALLLLWGFGALCVCFVLGYYIQNGAWL